MRGRIARELVGAAGVARRNGRLTLRHGVSEVTWVLWAVATTLSVAFIAQGLTVSGAHLDVVRATTMLVIGAAMWSFLGMTFQVVTDTIGWEHMEGTIEFTFMAPLSRAAHLWGMSAFALVFSLVRAVIVFLVAALLLDVDVHRADLVSAAVVTAVASLSIVGLATIVAVLPLTSPEKGTQMTFIAQGVVLVVSGVYYPIDVLPGWMQAIAHLSPVTYALDGVRRALMDGAGLGALWGDLWPLLVMGAVLLPAGLLVFRAAERHAKVHGKLRRSG